MSAYIRHYPINSARDSVNVETAQGYQEYIVSTLMSRCLGADAAMCRSQSQNQSRGRARGFYFFTFICLFVFFFCSSLYACLLAYLLHCLLDVPIILIQS